MQVILLCVALECAAMTGGGAGERGGGDVKLAAWIVDKFRVPLPDLTKAKAKPPRKVIIEGLLSAEFLAYHCLVMIFALPRNLLHFYVQGLASWLISVLGLTLPHFAKVLDETL
ncbi:hypothetical protein Pelo_7053 [Pelomyxa schiedti]|nr:hypothetical protein Pelo_7053 [Pelomyxa schiedti]